MPEARHERKRLRDILHSKRERLQRLVSKKEKLDEDIKSQRPRVCFGTRQLFNAQHHLQENGYATHAQWKADWDKARSNQIFMVGSHDESHGNQCATLTQVQVANAPANAQANAQAGTFNRLELRVRLPESMGAQYGLWLIVYLKDFCRGQAEVLEACKWRRRRRS